MLVVYHGSTQKILEYGLQPQYGRLD
jgi:hypothetical protein